MIDPVKKVPLGIKKVPLANGERMAYREAGAGEEVLILVHGNQSSSLFFEELMEALADQVHLFAPDLLGFGESSYEKAHVEMKDWGEDLALFMDALGIPSAVVLGWSAGGGAVLELAAQHPEKVKHLVLLASVGVKGFLLPRRDANLQPIPGAYLTKREDIIQDPVTMIPVNRAIAEKDKAFLHKVWALTIFNLHPPAEERFDRYMGEILKERCFTDISVALCNFNITHEEAEIPGNGRISKITCPVTWIHGRDDQIVSLATGEDSIRYFEGPAQLKILDQAGHASFMDQPEAFQKILVEVLEESK